MKNSIRTAVIICFAFLGALPLRGQELSLEIPLWATPPTENSGLTGPETKVGSKGFTANVSYPVLKVYRADAARNTGTAVLIAPGGGYGALAMRQEGDPFAAWLAGQGITGVVLTKLDGTPRGGCAVSVWENLGLPIRFIGVGEKIDDLMEFDAQTFVESLLPESALQKDEKKEEGESEA